MDRLLCGDVGFGKTEVALRAAFKCVTAGKQCAILVPTTILAQQHLESMKKRFAGFPVRIGLENMELDAFAKTAEGTLTVCRKERLPWRHGWRWWPSS